MHFLEKVKLGSRYMGPVDPGPGVPAVNRGILGFLFNKGERAATAIGLGLLKGAFGTRTRIFGRIPIDAALGVGLTATAAVLNIFTAGRSRVAPHVEAVGDTALTTWLHQKSVVWGHKLAGHAPPSWLAANTAIGDGDGAPTVAGELPQAAPGKYLSLNEIANWKAPRGAPAR